MSNGEQEGEKSPEGRDEQEEVFLRDPAGREKALNLLREEMVRTPSGKEDGLSDGRTLSGMNWPGFRRPSELPPTWWPPGCFPPLFPYPPPPQATAAPQAPPSLTSTSSDESPHIAGRDHSHQQMAQRSL